MTGERYQVANLERMCHADREYRSSTAGLSGDGGGASRLYSHPAVKKISACGALKVEGKSNKRKLNKDDSNSQFEINHALYSQVRAT